MNYLRVAVCEFLDIIHGTAPCFKVCLREPRFCLVHVNLQYEDDLCLCILHINPLSVSA